MVKTYLQFILAVAASISLGIQNWEQIRGSGSFAFLEFSTSLA